MDNQILDRTKDKRKESILKGRTALGIELGSTRIKAVLIDEDRKPIAIGNYDWENRYIDNIWTYSLEDIWQGVQGSYQDMVKNIKELYNINLTTIGAIGVSAMMHGYMVFNKGEQLLVPFRTWRNTITGVASQELTQLFQHNIPQRWSIAHLYQAILNGEEHIKDIDYMVTLSGYVHWKLTGQKVLGIGDAVGMFPVDSETGDYDEELLHKFDQLIAPKSFPWKLPDILPGILMAGDPAGELTEEGAKLLDISGNLKPGIPFCPPEGDAGTGMVATNSVGKRTGNVSAGTSVFAMVVLEKELDKLHQEIDMVTTPAGDPVAMVHCNNCTSDINAWVALFREFAEAMGMKLDLSEIFPVLFNKALEGDDDCGGLLSYCYLSGEHITGFEEGRPLFVRTPDSKFNLANFMRVNLFTSLGALRIGMDILFKEEKVKIENLIGHGGFFKTKGVGQKIMAAAMHTPVSVMDNAGEGGAWGIALLADYMLYKCKGENLESTLDGYLANHVFAESSGITIEPDQGEVESFERFMKRYIAGFPIERAAIEALK